MLSNFGNPHNSNPKGQKFGQASLAQLMPEEKIWQILQENNYDSASAQKQSNLVMMLSHIYGVPTEQVLLRIQEVKDLHEKGTTFST